MPVELIATSTMGLEAVVSRELKALGYQNRIIQLGRIAFQGDETALCRANLWLRAAGRVLVRMGTFGATDFGQLFDCTYALPWERWIPPDGAFPVSGRSLKSQLSSVPACQKIVKKAVAEKLMAAHGARQLPEAGSTYQVEVSLLSDEATLTIDTTGSGLHKRGYRPIVGKAPLRETLAAGLVQLSFWKPERPLVDPFCGTGTIPIEAALIGRNLAPGINRRFAAEDWPTVSTSQWEAARTEARDLARPALAERIIGTDVDEEALGQARYHAELAGVAEDIHFQKRDFMELLSKRLYGCVITNPPYAERMGTSADVEELYRAMPEVLRRLKTWSHYILTAYPAFEALIGQKADRRRKLYNSRIECTYYQFHGPNPETAATIGRRSQQPPTSDDREGSASEDVPQSGRSQSGRSQSGRSQSASPTEATTPEPTTVATVQRSPTSPKAVQQAFGGLSEKARHQSEIFRSRLGKLTRHLRRWPTKQGITCYRLYDRDVPEIPLVVERYEDCLHISEYERPHERTPAEHADWLDLMVRTAGEVLDVHPSRIFLKRRIRQRGTRQHERYAREQRVFVVSEGGLKFQVNLSDYVDTGLFLDHRVTRSMVREMAHGKRFLNLFGYTGAFTVYAVAGGAQSTATVDLSNTYLNWAQQNLVLNGLAAPEHRFVQADAMGFLAGLPEVPCYDLAVVDPPTFSNSKKTEHFWDVQRDHAGLLNRLLTRMVSGGVILFSTNFRRFKLTEADLQGAQVREISRQTVPADFRNKRVHRCWRMVRTECVS